MTRLLSATSKFPLTRKFDKVAFSDFEISSNAEIAQLVEHDLAKVGVAGPSPVFRSTHKSNAQMAESVDALVSNTSGAIHPGSIPGLGTTELI